MMANWTPGPWEVREDYCARCREEGTTEYNITPPQGTHGQFAERADAVLAAAAPMLAEALRPFARAADGYSERVTDSFVIDEFDDTADGGEHWRITLGDCRRARAVLAAAMGDAK